MAVYRWGIYGITVDADFPMEALEAPFVSRGDRSDGAPDVTIERGDFHVGVRPLLELGAGRSGRRPYRLFATDRGPAMSVLEAGDFLVERSRILYRPAAAIDHGFRACILGQVLSLWLELSGRIVFHAASVVFEDRALGILGPSGCGKSSLALACLRSGFRLLGEDKLVVRVEGHRASSQPAAPWLTVFEDSLGAGSRSTVGHATGRVEGGKYLVEIPGRLRQLSPAPLDRLVVLESRKSGVRPRLVDLPQSRALIELLRHSFLARSLSALGLDGTRAPKLAQILQLTGAKSLSLPSGLEELPAAARLLQGLLAGTEQATA